MDSSFDRRAYTRRTGRTGARITDRAGAYLPSVAVRRGEVGLDEPVLGIAAFDVGFDLVIVDGVDPPIRPAERGIDPAAVGLAEDDRLFRRLRAVEHAHGGAGQRIPD